MNYDKMSDFEINKAVAIAEGLLINEEQSASLKAKSSSVLVNDIVQTHEFNPCNNILDMWPLIVDSGIDINKNHIDGLWYALSDSAGIGLRMACNKNPLRAAAICYLKIKERSI